MGSSEVVDGLVKDGLWDPYNHIHMGSCAEMCAEQFGFAREAQVGGVNSPLPRQSNQECHAVPPPVGLRGDLSPPEG